MKNKVDNAIELLGLSAKDKVTGFSGVITTVSYDLYGCIQLILTPPAKDDKISSGSWFDVDRLVLLDTERAMPVPKFNENYILDYSKGPAEKPTMTEKPV